MELILQRERESKEWTQGRLYIDDNRTPECFTLEDQNQQQKVTHETRIPAGRYEIKLRTFGRHHERYSQLFKDFHKGTLWLQNVPGFTDILIHIGNDDDDTSGCLLVGQFFVEEAGKVLRSTIAYERLYKKIIAAFYRGEKVFITIKDING